MVITDKKKIIGYGLQFIIAGILVISGIMKIIDPEPLMESVEALGIENTEVITFISVFLPLVELSAGVMLFTGTKNKIVISGTIVLFILFLAVSIYGYSSGLSNDCGCFGNLIKSKFGISLLLKNIFFTIVLISWLFIK